MSARSFIAIPLIASACLLATPAFAQLVDDTAASPTSDSAAPEYRPRIMLADDMLSDAAEDEAIDTQHRDSADQPEVADNEPAQFSPSNADAQADEAEKDSVIKGHGLQLGMTFLGMPDSFIDHWFYYHGSTWEDATNMGFSLDYSLRFKRPCEMRFSLSWINAKTGDAYWLQQDQKYQTQLADYVRQNYSIVALEVAAYHIIPIVQDVSVLTELDFYYGGGLWGGVILGSAEKYPIRATCAHESSDITQCPHEPTGSPFLEMPGGIGFVTVTLGFKFTLAEILTIRAEGGFKGYFYGQLGMGVEF